MAKRLTVRLIEPEGNRSEKVQAVKVNEAPPVTARATRLITGQTRRWSMGRGGGGFAASFCAILLALILTGSKPVYSYLRNSLIMRFPAPALGNTDITGIIVLGGASDPASPSSQAADA
jgi:hypothetical protein